MLFYCSGHVISLEVCPSAEDYTDDVSDQCRDIIKRLQYVNPPLMRYIEMVLYIQCHNNMSCYRMIS